MAGVQDVDTPAHTGRVRGSRTVLGRELQDNPPSPGMANREPLSSWVAVVYMHAVAAVRTVRTAILRVCK